MPNFSIRTLHRLGSEILQRAGANHDESNIVITELLDANLVGHDSHGVIRLKQYVDSMIAEEIKPGSEIGVVCTTPGITVIDGNFNLGRL